MIRPGRISLVIAPVIATFASTAIAATTRVVPARGATRAGLLHTFVVQDGSTAGVTGEYVTRAMPKLGVVCQKTPDGRMARFVFRRAGGSWRFVLNTTGSHTGNPSERALERACR